MWKENTDLSTERTPSNLTTYKEAMLEFSENAQKFIECIPLLTKSRDAYQRAMKASMELRSALDAGDETLVTLMGHLEQAVKNLEQVVSERKKPELAKVRPIKAEDAQAVNEPVRLSKEAEEIRQELERFRRPRRRVM
jgi:chromosome segregation ATPase